MNKIIDIGNSKGVRIPKPIIEQAQLDGCEIEFRVLKSGLLLKRIVAPRHGWAEKIQKSLKQLKQREHLDVIQNTFDKEEWQWPE